MGDALVAAIHHDPGCAEIRRSHQRAWTDQPASLSKTNAWPRSSRRRHASYSARARESSNVPTSSATNSSAMCTTARSSTCSHSASICRTALAQTSQDDRTRPVLERCLAETTRALDDLRELSHGLYPPSLQAGGLVPALRALGHRGPCGREDRMPSRPSACRRQSSVRCSHSSRMPQQPPSAASTSTSNGATPTSRCGSSERILRPPKSSPTASQRSTAASPATTVRSSAVIPMRVVVAEDQLLTREGIVRVLRDAGCRSRRRSRRCRHA